MVDFYRGFRGREARPLLLGRECPRHSARSHSSARWVGLRVLCPVHVRRWLFSVLASVMLARVKSAYRVLVA